MKPIDHRFLLLTLAALFLSLFPVKADEIKVGAVTRDMIVYVPKGLPPNSPLIISMHGRGQSPEYQRDMAKFEPIADKEKFAVVYPRGLNNGWDIQGTGDIDFLLAIIEDMHKRYKIDTKRVYLSGFSMGGMMTYHAARKIADKIAAFAPVSGYLMGGPDTASSRPIPIIHIHGTTDDVVPFDRVQSTLDAWIKRDKVSTKPKVTKPYPAGKPGSPASKTSWGPGADGVEVVLITLPGKGHWYSMDPVQVNSSEEIWNFVKKYSLKK